MHPQSLTGRLGVASLAVLALTVPAACGGSSGEGESGELAELSGEEFFPAVVAAMQEAGTATFEMTSTTQGGPATASLDLTGEARFEDGSVDMTATDSGAGAFSMVFVDGILYMQGKGLDLGDKEWLRIDTTEKSQESSLFGMLATSANPLDTFAALGAPDEFELLGQEHVEGVATNHYRLAYASTKFAEAMEMPPAIARFLPRTVGVEMWVDADDLPRRFHHEVETSIPHGPTSKTVVDGTYSDFGTEVAVETPPESDVTEDLQLQGVPKS